MAELQADDVATRKVIAEGRRRPGVYTVAELGALYVDHARTHRGLKEATTLKDYESGIRNHRAPYFGDRPIQKIDAALIERFATHLRTKKEAGSPGREAAESEVGRELPRDALNVAQLPVRKKWLSASPMTAVDLPAHKIIEQGDAPIATSVSDQVRARAGFYGRLTGDRHPTDASPT